MEGKREGGRGREGGREREGEREGGREREREGGRSKMKSQCNGDLYSIDLLDLLPSVIYLQ